MRKRKATDVVRITKTANTMKCKKTCEMHVWEDAEYRYEQQVTTRVLTNKTPLERANIHTLSDDVLLLLFEWCGHGTLEPLSVTCKRFREIVRRIPKIRVDSYSRYVDCTPQFAEWLLEDGDVCISQQFFEHMCRKGRKDMLEWSLNHPERWTKEQEEEGLLPSMCLNSSMWNSLHMHRWVRERMSSKAKPTSYLYEPVSRMSPDKLKEAVGYLVEEGMTIPADFIDALIRKATKQDYPRAVFDWIEATYRDKFEMGADEICEKIRGYISFYRIAESQPILEEAIKRHGSWITQPSDPIAFLRAAEDGDIKLMECMLEHNYAVDNNAIEGAAARGHFEAVQWIWEHVHPCPWTDEFVGYCSRADYRKCQRPPPDATDTLGTQMARWAISKECPMTARSCKEALYSIPVIRVLREHGCPWDKELTTSAADLCHADTLKWLIEQGCPADEGAYYCDDPEVWNLLLDKGIPCPKIHSSGARFWELESVSPAFGRWLHGHDKMELRDLISVAIVHDDLDLFKWIVLDKKLPVEMSSIFKYIRVYNSDRSLYGRRRRLDKTVNKVAKWIHAQTLAKFPGWKFY